MIFPPNQKNGAGSTTVYIFSGAKVIADSYSQSLRNESYDV